LPLKKQRGLVLIVSIVLLAIVSVLAAFSTRNAASAENASGNVRLMELATQAAEVALRHCEDSVAHVIAIANGETSDYETTFAQANILPESMQSAWESAAGWDTNTPNVFVLPLEKVNQAGLAPTYKRPPECMVVRMPFVLPGGSISTDTAFVITARGFGPEVEAADPQRRRPAGSEVWLQSHIQLQ
jgi:Tfp pilus assembly protein PilX